VGLKLAFAPIMHRSQKLADVVNPATTGTFTLVSWEPLGLRYTTGSRVTDIPAPDGVSIGGHVRDGRTYPSSIGGVATLIMRGESFIDGNKNYALGFQGFNSFPFTDSKMRFDFADVSSGSLQTWQANSGGFTQTHGMAFRHRWGDAASTTLFRDGGYVPGTWSGDGSLLPRTSGGLGFATAHGMENPANGSSSGQLIGSLFAWNRCLSLEEAALVSADPYAPLRRQERRRAYSIPAIVSGLLLRRRRMMMGVAA
jgi:hypothetical protein